MTEIRTTKINPNFSVVTEAMPDLQSASIGVFFSCGSRTEDKSQQGITHLIEHMLFKGTKQRTAGEISSFTEGKGAVIDGFTTKETSGIYCRYFADNFKDMIGLINEIISSSLFNSETLEKEKNIILQEIAEAEDNPQEHVFDLLHQVLFNEHSLSFPISGTPNTVTSLTLDKVVDYYHKKYLSSRICVSAAGKIDHNQLVDQLQIKTNSAIGSNPLPLVKPDLHAERKTIFQTRKDIKQLYAAAAGFTYSYQDDQRFGMILLNNIWGGTMSSRLFHRIRETEGLVYTIFSFIDFYSDIGIMGAFFISDVENTQRIFEAGYDETIKIQKFGVTKDELDRSINYSKSLLVLGAEDPMSRMIRNAKNNLLLGKIIPIEESISKLEKYTVDQLNDLTKELPMQYSVANIAPFDQSEYLKKSGGPQTIIRDAK